MAVPKSCEDERANSLVAFLQRRLEANPDMPEVLRLLCRIAIDILKLVSLLPVRDASLFFYIFILFAACWLVYMMFFVTVVIWECILQLTNPEYLPPLIIGVMSRRDNFMQRLTIRNTWAVDVAQMEQNTKLIFVLGDSDCPYHPDMRTDKSTCTSYVANQDPSHEFSSAVIESDELRHDFDSHPKIVGFGMKTLTDIVVINVVKLIPYSEIWMKVDETEMILLNFVGAQNILLEKGSHVEFIVQNYSFGDEDSRLVCDWSHGNGSVDYMYVRHEDKTIEPWSPNYCVPFIVNFENGEELCPEGWHQFQGNCYYYSQDELNWEDAAATCNELDSHLVSVHTQEENDFIKGRFHQNNL